MKSKKLISLLLIIGLIVGSLLTTNSVQAEDSNEKYSIEYLLKNYNVVALGHDDIIDINNNESNYKKGEIKDFTNITGAVLVNGDYTSEGNSTFGLDAGEIKSFIKGTRGNNVNTTSQLVTDSNYIDFNKLYANVMSESQAIADNSEYNINSAQIEISKPGIYTIDNTSIYTNDSRMYSNNSILIKNYDKNKLYVINYYNEVVTALPSIVIMEPGSATSTSIKELVEAGQYTGNIIWNFPNAKSITISTYYSYTGVSGHIVAPKAFVWIINNYQSNVSSDNYNSYNNSYYGTIIANSIYGRNHTATNNTTTHDYYSYYSYLIKTNYTLNKRIIDENINEFLNETHDYKDDYYSRDYSISDLLQNYSLITLEHKQIDSKSKILQFTNKAGSVKIFHVTGQALISGDLYRKTYPNERDDSNYWHYYYQNDEWGVTKFDRVAFDLESNEVTESYIKGNTNVDVNIYKQVTSENGNVNVTVIQPWDNMANDNIFYYGRKNSLFLSKANDNASNICHTYFNFDTIFGNICGSYNGALDNYINFDRLYNNIVSEQKEIEEGTNINPSNGKAHVRVGGSYVIDDINDINEIVFDNFEEEKDKITIITIKNEGDINFPLISKDTGNYKGIVTNDYFGKERATHLYEQNTFISEDSYHGNIIWNIPNATYIKLKENAPFAGHMIAPNADVDTPETHFAGCFIVNSIYGEGNTEAHFYPLTSTATYEVPEYNDLTESEKTTLGAMRLKRLLGGSASTIETTVLGDETEFRKEEAKLNEILDKEQNKTSNNTIAPIIDILQNPLTKRSVLIIGSILTIISVTIYFTFKKKA